ncbi:DUF5914 domain-containing protein [Streptomyces tendae]
MTRTVPGRTDAAGITDPRLRAAAGRLWRDDLVNAERRQDLRARGLFPG